MSTVAVECAPAKSEVAIQDIMSAEWREWAAKYLAEYRQSARFLPRHDDDFHRLSARMAAGPMPGYPLPKPTYRSTAKFAEEDPEAFERASECFDDCPPSPPMTEAEMDDMARYYGQPV